MHDSVEANSGQGRYEASQMDKATTYTSRCSLSEFTYPSSLSRRFLYQLDRLPALFIFSPRRKFPLVAVARPLQISSNLRRPQLFARQQLRTHQIQLIIFLFLESS